MKTNLFSALSGFLFALGLAISGLTSPIKVMAFLDIFGSWDASLIFVMAGGILVYSIGYPFITKRQKPICTERFELPKKKNITPSLILGSALFGIGWGLAGFCPGPALTSLGSLNLKVTIFVVSMLIGMALFHQFSKKNNPSP